jgi:DNA-binding NarL/FixJ family response regulator
MTIIHDMSDGAPMVKVALIDDHDLLRRGIKTMLESEPDIEVVGEAADGAQALKLVEEALPDVVLIDVIMPHKDGIEATKEIKDAFPNMGVVVLSGHDERQFLFDALKAGASGYMLKTADLEEVVATVRSAAKGEAKLDPSLATQVLSEFQAYQRADVSEVYQPLTPREREILRLMSDGLPNKTIASRLSISERTVTTHIANIYSKLHVNNRVSAIQEATRRRLLDFNRQRWPPGGRGTRDFVRFHASTALSNSSRAKGPRPLWAELRGRRSTGRARR